MAIDVVSLAERCAVLPRRVSSPDEARAALFRDGAAILTGLDGSHDTATSLAVAVLGERLIASGKPVEVTDGGGVDDRRTSYADRRMLPLHSDGFVYGPLAPDVFFLLCSVSSPHDGYSFLVDMLQMVHHLDGDSDGTALSRFLRDHVVDQTQPGGTESVGPMIGSLPSGAPTMRRSLDVRPCDADPDPARSSRMLTLWQGLLDATGAMAERFSLGEGEALAVDNTRLAHGRDAYTTPDRLLWRCWAWTDRCEGVPPGELWSDTRMALTRDEH